MRQPPAPAAFLDRDGVINEERHYVHRIEDFVLLPGATAGMQRLQEAGYRLVVVTNQAGIGRGLYSEDDFARLTQHMLALLRADAVEVSGVYHCPHHPEAQDPRYRLDCDCRKPAPGLLLRAGRALGLDLGRSVLVGDKRSDLQAGRAAGLARCVLVASGHAITEHDRAHADHSCADLAAAARWLTGAGDDVTETGFTQGQA